MFRLALLSLVLAGTLALIVSAAADKENKDAGFVSLFDGKTLKGWHVSGKTGHSKVSGNKTGGKWFVADAALLGTQDVKGNGGNLITDQAFGDFEVVLEMRNDFGPDSGLFLRCTEDGHAYQAMIDYHAKGNLMGIYGEGQRLGGKPHVRNFTFLDKVTEIKEDPAPFKLPIPPEKWCAFWKHGKWNELRARIVGNPPHITTWIKGVKFMDYTDTEKRLADQGGIALQVHGGGDYRDQFVRYRHIRVKALGK